MLVIKKEKTERLMNHYGPKCQQIQLMEECSELIQAASKCIRADVPYNDNFIEEMGDVYMVLEQFYNMLLPYQKQALSKSINFKINRQLARIEEENNDED